jgi:hypothetical protein
VRRIRAVLFAGAAGLALTACGGSTTAAPPPSSSTTSKATTTTAEPATTAPTTTIPATTAGTTAAPTTTAAPSTTVSPTTVATTTVAPPPTTSAILTACEPSQLNINLSGGQAAAGTEYYGFNVVNISQQACPLGGYFGVSIYNPAGSLVSSSDYRDSAGSSSAPAAVNLAPGATASFSVGLGGAQPPTGAACPSAGSFHLIPPNAATDVQVSVPVDQTLPGCSGQIIVRPVASGASPLAN